MGQECHCYPNLELEYFLLNTKRTTGPVKLKSGDLITIGQYSFKLLDYARGQIISRQENLENALAEIKEKNPGLHQSVHYLAQIFGVL